MCMYFGFESILLSYTFHCSAEVFTLQENCTQYDCQKYCSQINRNSDLYCILVLRMYYNDIKHITLYIYKNLIVRRNRFLSINVFLIIL